MCGGVCRRVTPEPIGKQPARGDTTGPWHCTLVEQRKALYKVYWKYIVCVCGRPFLRPALRCESSISMSETLRNTQNHPRG